MLEPQNRVFRPIATAEWLAWSAAATTADSIAFRERAIAYNMVSQSQIGRPAFVVEQVGQSERLRIKPPLNAAELHILSGVPYFREVILQEGTNV
jgi:hypothetical protein